MPAASTNGSRCSPTTRRYWVPLQGARQVDPLTHNSLAYEDRLLLQLRVDRLKNPRAHSQHPASHCQHVLQRSLVEGLRMHGATAELVLRTPFLYVEARGESTGDARRHLPPPAGAAPTPAWRSATSASTCWTPGRALPAIQLFI